MSGPSFAFVGRKQELDACVQAIQEAAAGSFRLVEVTGEPGIGKTRLLTEVARLATEQGMRVLAGQSFGASRSSALAPLLDAFDGDRSTGDDPRARFESALAQAATGGGTDPAARTAHDLHRTVRTYLEATATGAPGTGGLTLLLDDLHLADRTTIILLAELVRRPPQAAVLLVVAYRQRQAPLPLFAAITDASAGPTVRRMTLEGLTIADAEALLGAGHSRAGLRALLRESGGNPFYLDALAHAGTDVTGAPTDGLSPVARIRLMHEAAAASPSARQVLDSAAVLGATFEPTILAELTGRELPHVLHALDELVRLDLVRPDPGGLRFAFRHPLLGQAVYATTSPGWRLAAHSRAIDALRRRGASPLALARHVDQAAIPGRLDAVAVLRKAANAVAAEAPLISVRWLRTALRLLPEQPQHDRARVALLVRLARMLGVAGQLHESRDTMHEALRLLPRHTATARAHAVAFCVLIERLLCRRMEADALLRAELDALPGGHAVARATLLFELACSEFAAGRHAVCAEIADQVQTACRPYGSRMRATRAAALGLTAVATAAMTSTAVARERLDEAVQLLDAMLDGEFKHSLAAAMWVIWGEVLLERWDDALRHVDRAIAFARRNNQTLALPHLYVKRVLVLRCRGRLVEAQEVAEDAVDLAHTCGGGEQVTIALMMHSWISVLCGDVEAGVRSGLTATDRLRLQPSDWSNMLAYRMLAEARLAAGDPAGCLDLVTVVGGPELPLSEVCSRVYWFELLTRAEIALGRIDQAEAWADQAEAVAAPLDLPSRTGLALLCRAHVLTARRAPEALAMAGEAATILADCGAVFDATRARVVGATALVTLGRVDEAAAELRAAQTEFQSYGATGLARQVRLERRRLAARGSRRGAGSDAVGVDSLTRREQQVATLVSDGLTNRRIAQELFVTEKTVEMHLANIFVKLGVTSRVAVARLVGVVPT